MASYTESQAVFEARLRKAGLSEATVQAIVGKNITSVAQFAFISSYTPGVSDESPLINAFKDILGRDPTVAESACWRRAFHESYAAATMEIRQTLEKVDDVQTRKLTQPERNDRYLTQQRKLKGLSIRGVLEPGDSLIDLACAIYDENRLRYICLTKCCSKEQELLSGSRKDTAFVLDAGSGKLRVEAKASADPTDTSSDVLLQYALERRALAMDQANLLDYHKGHMWTERLMKARLEEPPIGFAKPSSKQLIAADQRLFLELADATRSGVQVTAQGRPLDNVFEATIKCHDVACLLQPMPRAPAQVGVDSKEVDNAWRAHPYGGKGKGKKGKGKGKGSLPQALVALGCRGFTNQGHPICYGYNLGDCKNAVSKGRCDKGFHVCAIPACGGHHPATKCQKAKAE